jgi:ElaB/YqjD/DUF883 family membrane-anchored ribosome-binding protein
MDEQRVADAATDAAGKVRDTVSDLAAQTQANMQSKLDQGRAGLQDLKASAGDAVERATAVARDVSAASTQAAAQAGEVIQGVAREVGNQASQAATALYQQGTNAGGYLSRYTAEQPLTALLLAAAFGYALAYIIHRS